MVEPQVNICHFDSILDVTSGTIVSTSQQQSLTNFNDIYNWKQWLNQEKLELVNPFTEETYTSGNGETPGEN